MVFWEAEGALPGRQRLDFSMNGDKIKWKPEKDAFQGIQDVIFIP